MRRLALLALLCTACTTHTIPVVVFSQTQAPAVTDERHPDVAIVEKAAAMLGLSIELVTKARGAIQVEIVTVKSGYPGRKYGGNHCIRVVRCDSVETCAHEIAHALRLGHVDDPRNVMHRYVGKDTTKIEEWQRDIMWRSLARLQACN